MKQTDYDNLVDLKIQIENEIESNRLYLKRMKTINNIADIENAEENLQESKNKLKHLFITNPEVFL